MEIEVSGNFFFAQIMNGGLDGGIKEQGRH